MALQDLMLAVPPDRFGSLKAAFREGYTAINDWPETAEATIDTFRAGRLLWVSDWIAKNEAEHLPSYVRRVRPLFERFLETGDLRLAAG